MFATKNWRIRWWRVPPYGALDRELRGEFQALESLLHDLEASRQLDLKSQDQLLGFGECFSSRLVKEALSPGGIQAAHVDAQPVHRHRRTPRPGESACGTRPTSECRRL